MNAKEFFDKVSMLRSEQKAYYACPREDGYTKKQLLDKCRAIEKELDAEIARVKKIFASQKQQNLFKK